MTPKEILFLPMDPARNDAGASTIGEYLKALLMQVWTEQEGFSGKRPFGNSGWQYDMLVPLVKAGLIQGEFDEEGFLEYLDPEQEKIGNLLIRSVIASI
jgi:hypothetical protein